MDGHLEPEGRQETSHAYQGDRDWCAHCVVGRGVSHKHRTSDRESTSDTAEFCLDYALTTKEGRAGYLEDIGVEDDAGLSPVLVGHDRSSEALLAMMAEGKGTTEASIKWAKERIGKSGYLGIKVVLNLARRRQARLSRERLRSRGRRRLY